MAPARPTGQQNGGGPADPGRIMSPSPGADATVTDRANTVLIRSPVACSCTNLGWSRERGGAPPGMGVRPRRLHVEPHGSTVTRWARSYRRLRYLSGTPA